MQTEKWEYYSKLLLKSERERQPLSPLTELEPTMTVNDAYQIQLRTIEQKMKEGHQVVGKKIGLTSAAMQQLLGVDQPDYGHLLDSMMIENGGTVPWERVMQPKVEAEIAFVLKRDLVGSRITVLDVLQATDYIVPALEIVDSRIVDWKIRLEDTVADNASSGLYVLGGKPIPVHSVDVAQIGMALYRNGEVVNTGVGAAALGHPAFCVAWLANKLYEYGKELRAGEVVLSGALSAAVSAEPGDFFSARFAHLGEVRVQFAL
ncbi:2-keto-4-pentenoate hydratase [Paranoxybacillus vitaminiphilus]|uniref:2-keto-4-pentenoate hydratase n=1 Tax=Paranoxybacillus vitaminiphilus TaxID=581036 RepID=UPI000DB96883|nr:2-keto-4-pentenoate hydratase [Anoxybacillus vitaminiphilus]